MHWVLDMASRNKEASDLREEKSPHHCQCQAIPPLHTAWLGTEYGFCSKVGERNEELRLLAGFNKRKKSEFSSG
jgi:hypothetical protein